MTGHKVQIRLYDALFEGAAQAEAELLAEALHGAVFEEDLGGDPAQPLGLADLEELLEQDGPEALALEAVVHENGELGLIGDGVVPAETGYAQDLRLPGLGVLALGDEGHLAVVVYKADAREALVGGPAGEVHRVEVAHVDAALGERLVELDHQRLVLGPDGTHGYGRAVFQLRVADVLIGVGPNGGSGQIFLLGVGIVQDDPGV